MSYMDELFQTIEGSAELRDLSMEDAINRLLGFDVSDERLHQLASMPYHEYLQTEEWQFKRQVALSRAEFRCELCNSDSSLHVHHRTYARRGNERSNDLTVLCALCHELFHTHRRVFNV